MISDPAHFPANYTDFFQIITTKRPFRQGDKNAIGFSEMLGGILISDSNKIKITHHNEQEI